MQGTNTAPSKRPGFNKLTASLLGVTVLAGAAAAYFHLHSPAPVAVAAEPAATAPLAAAAPTIPEAAASLPLQTAALPPPPPSSSLPLPDPGDSSMMETVQVESGDTLMDLLMTAGIGRAEAHNAINALGDVFSPKDLMPGQQITLGLNLHESINQDSVEVELASIALQPSVERDVMVERRDDGEFQAKAVERPLTTQMALASARINSSLYQAGQDAAVPLSVLSEVIKAFAYDVDFEREIHPGDSFEIVYERLEDDQGRLARTGNIRYAALTQGDQTLEIYWFEPKEGSGEFYNAKGESVRKDLLRTPLDVVRVTSGYGMRKHPILGYSKMHKGVDFAAATGTPILASGSGVVEFAGKKGGYGNFIKIRHGGQYQTAYAHLSRFAKGISKGDKVKQGQVIGYVGSTGNSTGPHLHYEVIVAGKNMNPMKLKFAGRKLDGKELRKFEAVKADIKKLRQQLVEETLVARNQQQQTTPARN
ncbi:MAG: peptidoglycan DD-metalloendopeptidase family protein [Dongiaceae bacterium]